MKVVVTGAAGFIGSALSRRLLALGHQVIGIDCITDYYSPKLKYANLESLRHAEFTHIKVDINSADLSPLIADAEVIFHQAGQPGVRKSWGSDFTEYIEMNISATQKLLEAARSLKTLKRFVYASSSSIYGNAEAYPTREDMRPDPVSPYGVTKLAAEHLCTLYASNFGLPTTSLRYFTVYGPGQRPDMAFTRFTHAAAVGGQITLYGKGDQIRDFTYIDDIVEANIAAALTDTRPGTVMNVAGGGSITVNQALDIIANLSGSNLQIKRIDTIDGDVFQTGGSIERIRSLLNWEPKISVEDGLRRHYEWSASQLSNVDHG